MPRPAAFALLLAARRATAATVRATMPILMLGLLLTLATPAGCGSDDVGPQSRMVGGRCTTDGDCVKRCLTGGRFPGGYCALSCTTDSDCPGGSACVALEGGVCLATCRIPADCDGYGVGYQCNRQTSQAMGAGPLACAGP